MDSNSNKSDKDTSTEEEPEPLTGMDLTLEKLRKFAEPSQPNYPINHIHENIKLSHKINKVKDIKLFHRNFVRDNS